MINYKSAQIQTQVFVYIVSILVAVLILLYGYRAITTFIQSGERISLLNAEQDLISIVDATSYERVKIDTFEFPKRYVKLCLVDLSKPYAQSRLCKTGPDFNEAVCLSWTEAIKENVFLVDDTGITSKLGKGFIGNIVLDNPGCFDIINSRIQLRFTGVERNTVKIDVI
jgi:hypothetical protein